MSPDGTVVVEIFGEGKTDMGHSEEAEKPTRGVVPILVHTLCDRPKTMMVKRRGVPFLQQKGSGKGLWQKVRFAGRQALGNKSDAVVYVVDSEGDLKGRMKDLVQGREHAPSKLSMAVGVAHPCIESWLLADATAIRRGMELTTTPAVPEEPEKLSAPCRDRKHNPKMKLAEAAWSAKRELSAKEKDRIAAAMNDLDLVRTRCPLGFGPFAEEVGRHIAPLF